jgi:aryl-alcohol dehydrogenase-like predicted oxidoreductase
MAARADRDTLPPMPRASSSADASRATPAGTGRFAHRFAHLPGHFRRPDELWLSSLALGTRNGEVGGVDDVLYRSVVPRLLEGGVNVFVTALSDRMQTSERCLGAALERAFREGAAARDEVVVVTKGGTLTVDPDLVQTRAQARRYLIETYIDSGLVDPDDVSMGVHCLAPDFLRDQIRRSLRNLRLETIDLYLIEEPEQLLRDSEPTEYQRRMHAIFEALEEEVDAGRIAAFGLATWDGLLRPHTDRHHLSILELFDWALEVGGADHHLRAVQLPYSLATAEALKLPTQWMPPGGTHAVLEALHDTGTAVLASTPLAQGRILGRIPRFVADAMPGTTSDAQRCLQFVRSTKGITAAVVGMRDPDHVEDNLALTGQEPASPELVEDLFKQAETHR